MFYNNIKDLKSIISLYNKYLFREVLHITILKNKYIRYAFAFVFVIFLFGMSYVWYSVFATGVNSDEIFRVILRAVSTNLLMYTILIFSFLKILFLKARGLIQFSLQLPTTNQVRNLSFICYETIFSIIILLTISLPVAIGLIFHTGNYFLVEIFNLVFMFFTFYNLLNFLFYIFLKVLNKIISNKYISSLIILSLFIISGYIFVQHFFIVIIKAYPQLPETFVFSLLFEYISTYINFFASFLTFVVINFLLYVFLLNIEIISDNRFSKFVNIEFKNNTLKKSYFSYILKCQDNIILILLCVIIYIIGIYFNNKNSLLIFLILSYFTFYSVSETKSLRYIWKSLGKYSVLKDYFLLLFSGILSNIFISLIFILFEILCKNYLTVIYLVLGIFILNIYTLMISILFPPENDNPFSIIIGTGISFVFGIISVVLIALLAQNLKLLIFYSIIQVLSMIYISVLALTKYKIIGGKYED